MKYFNPIVIISLASTSCFADIPESTFNSQKNQTDKYWTQDRIKNAKPAEQMVISKDEFQRIFKDAPSVVSNDKNDSPGLDGDTSNKTTPGIPEVADITVQPFRAAGKLYFTNDSGADRYCTAQFIKNANVLLTAGHCVRNALTKNWFTNFEFHPQYSNGNGGTPVGWHCATTWSSYTTPVTGLSQNWSKDYAFIYTSSPSLNGSLGNRVNNTENPVTAIGYPGNFESGKYLMRVTGEVKAPSNNIVEMVNNPMRSGNSGGAWIVSLGSSNVNGNYIAGINSFSYSNITNSEFSPVLDAKFRELLDFGVNKCAEL